MLILHLKELIVTYFNALAGMGMESQAYQIFMWLKNV